MSKFKFIELPKEEVVKESELSFIEGATDCGTFVQCADKKVGKSICEEYGTSPCGCAGSLFCGIYTF